MKLELRYPDPSGTTEQGEVIEGRKIGVWAKKAVQSKRFEDTKEKKWQGKLMAGGTDAHDSWDNGAIRAATSNQAV